MMRRIALMLIILWAMLMLTIIQQMLTASKTLALYNHPSQADAMVNVPPVRTLYMTPFEREVRARSVFGYSVPSVHTVTTVADWTSPKEGRVVLSKPDGRWHRGQAWRRSF